MATARAARALSVGLLSTSRASSAAARAPEDESAGEGMVWQPTGGTGRGMAWRPPWAKPTGAWRGGERRCRRRSTLALVHRLKRSRGKTGHGQRGILNCIVELKNVQGKAKLANGFARRMRNPCSSRGPRVGSPPSAARKMRPGVFRRRQRERRGPLADSRRRRRALVHEQGEGGAGGGIARRRKVPPAWGHVGMGPSPRTASQGAEVEGERQCRARHRRRGEKSLCNTPNAVGVAAKETRFAPSLTRRGYQSMM